MPSTLYGGASMSSVVSSVIAWISQYSMKYLDYWLQQREYWGHRPNLPPDEVAPVGTWVTVQPWLPPGQVIGRDEEGCYRVCLPDGVVVLALPSTVMVAGFDGPLPENWREYPDLPDPTLVSREVRSAPPLPVDLTGKWAA